MRRRCLYLGKTLAAVLCWAQTVARADDIVSIKSEQANTVYTAAGCDVDIKITLAGTFVLTDTYGGTLAMLPELRMIVNGGIGWATLHSLSQYELGGIFERTDVIFRYRIRPGDMAQPLRIYGSPSNPYQIYWNSWQIRNVAAQSNAVWRFAPWHSHPELGEVYDLDLAKSKITLQTLHFDDPNSPSCIQAAVTGTWRVTTANPVESAVVDFYVWTTQTNIVRLGSAPNQQAVLVSMPSGSTFADFPIRGLSAGTAEIYLQRAGDYQNNALAGVTNAIRRTVTVTEPPAPRLQIILSESGADTATLNETKTPNTGRFRVELSEAFTSDVTVRVSLVPANQAAVTFPSSPMTVVVPKNQTSSAEQTFSVPDGGVTGMWGVTLSPEIISAPADLHYTDLRTATVYVQNVKPAIVQPLATDEPFVCRGEPFAFEWSVADVPADMASGLTLTWNFGDGTPDVIVSNATGSVLHTFMTPAVGSGTKTVRVSAKDKDGDVSDEVQLTVTVIQPQPKPSVRVVPSNYDYNETATNNTGSLMLFLSEPFPEDVWVRLTSAPAGQSNIVFGTMSAIRIPSGYTNNVVPIKFSIPDGTISSETSGIDIIPTVTNMHSMWYFTDMQSATVYVSNVRPRFTKPLARDVSLAPLAPYDNVQRGIPFAFSWTVSDVFADRSSMAVMWGFGDGSTMAVTGVVGEAYHTYSSFGDKVVSVRAVDKDGGESEEILFKVTVTPPPDGFVRWAAGNGLSGDPDILFGLDHDGDGIANGFAYAFGTNLAAGGPLLNIRMVNGSPKVETPMRDPASTASVHVMVEGCTNLFSGDWSLPMGPSAGSGKPDNRDWYAPLVTVPDKAFFRLRAVRE